MRQAAALFVQLLFTRDVTIFRKDIDTLIKAMVLTDTWLTPSLPTLLVGELLELGYDKKIRSSLQEYARFMALPPGVVAAFSAYGVVLTGVSSTI